MKQKTTKMFSRAAMTLLLSVLTTMTAWADTETVSYIDVDGTTKTVSAEEVFPLGDGETTLGQDEQKTWYYVDNDITYNRTINCLGDVHIILADGKTLTITSNDGNGIDVNDGSLTIYGQEFGTGTLNATGGRFGINSNSGNITISGGTVNVTGNIEGIHSDSGNITISGGTVNVTGNNEGIHSDSGTITISGGTVNVTGNNEGIHSDSGSITISGGRVTVTGEGGAGIYSESGNITLGCTTASDFIYASSYFAGPQGKLKIADGQTLFDQYGTPYRGMLSYDDITNLDGVTLCSFPHVIAQYIDANGQPAQHVAIPLDGGVTTLGQDGQEMWYYVGNDITYNRTINCLGDVNIILADGKTMTNHGINGADGSLTIYGQAKGTGILTATGSSSVGIRADGFITINGGTVNATGNNDVGIYGVDGVTINGGTVNATGIMSDGNVTIKGGKVTSSSDPGFSSNSGDIILGWTTVSDFIYASSYVVGSTGTVKVADGQTLTDQNGNSYSGTLSADEISAISEQTLTPDFSVNDAGTEYTIRTATGWNYFCDMQEGGETFSGKTVVLAGDIGTPEDPVTRMGSSTTRFQGTFDGQGHTLTVQYGTPSEPVDQQFVAPFPVVEGAATFRNLIIAGSIYSGYATNGDKGTGGLIGCLRGGVTVEHCVSTVTVNAASDRAGGFVGLCEHAVTFTDCKSSAVVTCTGSSSGFVGWSRASAYTIAFEGCLFDGKVLKQGNVGSGNGSFVGWKGFTKTVTITNCLVDPAALTQGETMATDNSATFCRYSADTTIDNGETHITNCYYTQTLGAAQGKARHTVTAGTDVTVAHAGVATHYATSVITAYKATGASTDSDLFIAGLLYNDDDSDVLYAGIDDEVALTLSNTATGDVPAGYRYDVYTVSAGTISGSTLTMPDADVTVNVDTETLRSTGQAVSVSYVDANGQPASHDAIALDGTETTLNAGWYFVGTGISYSGTIYCNGDVNIILADGCTMIVTTSNANGIEVYADGSLTIYGQDNGTGTLNATGRFGGIYTNGGNITICGGTVTATSDNGYGISTNSGNITICGGRVTATSSYGDGIHFDSGTITISGGRVTATGYDAGIYTYSGTITLGCTTDTDFIYASSYVVGSTGTVKVADGQTLYDQNGNSYSGTLSDYSISTFPNGKTLRPLKNVLALYDSEDNSEAINGSNGQKRNVILYDRTLYKDGEWNTLCLPFNVTIEGSVLDGADVRALDTNATGYDHATGLDGNTLYLNFTAEEAVKKIEAGVPYIIKWPATEPDYIENPVFKDVKVEYVMNNVPFTGGTFKGTYAKQEYTEENKSILLLGAENTLYWPKPDGDTYPSIGAFRAYFELAGGQEARQFVLNFGEIETSLPQPLQREGSQAGAWFDLSGRKLDSKPTKKGVYIHEGRKVVIP